jgi:hypothetical protein
MLGGVDDDECSGQQVTLALKQCRVYCVTDSIWAWILCSDEDNTWPGCMSLSEQRTEIEVVSEDNVSVRPGPVQQFGVESASSPYGRPMNRRDPSLIEEWYPALGQIQVH